MVIVQGMLGMFFSLCTWVVYDLVCILNTTTLFQSSWFGSHISCSVTYYHFSMYEVLYSLLASWYFNDWILDVVVDRIGCFNISCCTLRRS